MIDTIKHVICLTLTIILLHAQSAFTANMVTGFSQQQYKGDSISWEIPTGYRHLLVHSISFPDGLRSIIVPQGLKVRYFNKPDFHDWYHHSTDIFSSSNGNISANSVKSLIVYPANQEAPAGIQVVGRAMDNLVSFPGVFFPLPESFSLTGMCFTDHTFKKWPMISARVYGQGMRAVLHSVDNCGTGVALELGNKKSGLGKNGAEFSGNQAPLNGMQNKVQSVYVESINTAGLTVFPKPVKVHPIKGSVIPGASLVAKLAGTWKSSINEEYTITQKGTQATWRASSFEQAANITINGKLLRAVYQDVSGNFITVNGSITNMLQDGYALRIDWDNGVFFMREMMAEKPSKMAPTDTAQKIISVAGIWQSDFGQTYTIKQTGDKFTWQVQNSDEKGQGRVKGQGVEASWNGSLGSGSNTGAMELIQNNHANRITWKNGVVFTIIAAE